MTKSVLAKLDRPVPCGTYKSAQDGVCGAEATIIILSPAPALMPLEGQWAGLPVCRGCVAEMAAVYGVDTAVEQPEWITLADAVAMAHALQPEKYTADTNYEVMKLRGTIKRGEWAERGIAKKTAGDQWLVSRAGYVEYLAEMRGKWIRGGDGDAQD